MKSPAKIKILSVVKRDLKPYWPQFIFLIFIGLISGASKSALSKIAELIFGLWQGDYTNESIKAQIPYVFDFLDLSLIIQLPILIVVLALIANPTRFLLMSRTKLISERICINLRKMLLNQYLYSSLSYLERFKSGSGGLISRMLSDIGAVQMTYYKVADLLKEPIVCVLSLAYLFWLNYQLTLSLFLILPLIAFITTRLTKSLKRNSRRNQENMEHVTGTLKETLDGSRIIRSFNLENKMKERFRSQIERFFGFRKKIVILEELGGPISEVIASFFVAGIMVYIGLMIQERSMAAHQVVGYIVALALLSDSGKKTQNAILRIQQGLVARTRMEELMRGDENHLIEQEDQKSFPETWSEIHFEGINYQIGDRKILNDINLTIKKGETVALVGPSGSGKTTLLNLIERFIQPNSGHIRIAGTSLSEMNLYSLRENIALVSQDVFLFQDSLEENIRASQAEAKFEDIVHAAKAAHVDQFIQGLPEKYQTPAGDRGQRLSGGEKQRISIARAFLKNAPILLLDEATSALDTESEFEVQKGLQELMEGKTCLVVAHRLSTIRNADRIVVIKNGEIVQIGNHEELSKDSGEYQRLLSLS